MLVDPAFLQDQANARLDVAPTDGATLQKIVADFVNTPADIVAQAKAAMMPKEGP